MPRVKTLESTYLGEAGEELTLRTAIEVDGHGRFSANVPDWLEGNLRNAGPTAASVARPRTNLRVECQTLAPIEALLTRALAEYSAPIVTTSVVIRYAVGTKAAGWRMDDGRIVPNGQVAERIGRDEGLDRGPSGRWGDWIAGLGVGPFNDAQVGYRVVLGAEVVRRVETRRGAAATVSYSGFDGEGLADPVPAMDINAYVHLDLRPDRHRDPGAEVREMPYTHEAGVFFADMMRAVTTLAAGLQAFFADGATLPARIAAGARPLSLPAPAPSEAGGGHDEADGADALPPFEIGTTETRA